MRTDERFKDRLPKIYVGICAFGDFSHEAFESFMFWWGQTCAKWCGRAELYLGLSPRKEQYRARNFLVQYAEEQGADFLLMLDDDQAPGHCPDMLEKFWELGKPVMGGLYYQRGGLYHPVVMKEFPGPNDQRKYRFVTPKELPTEPTPVDVVGHGCMWVDMEVYAKLKQPHHWPYPDEVAFVPDEEMGLDVHFCQRVRDMGEEVWFHPGIEIGHVAQSREVMSSATRPPQEEIEKSEQYRQYVMSVYANGTFMERDSAA